MKFRKVLTSIGTLNKQDFFDFDFTEEQLKEAKIRNYENPLFVKDGNSVISLYSEDGKLRVDYFTSYYGFKEGVGEHNPREFNNCILCSCGKRFPNGKQQKGKVNFEKHLKEIKSLVESKE